MQEAGLDQPELVGHGLPRVWEHCVGGDFEPTEFADADPERLAFGRDRQGRGDAGKLRVHRKLRRLAGHVHRGRPEAAHGEGGRSTERSARLPRPIAGAGRGGIDVGERFAREVVLLEVEVDRWEKRDPGIGVGAGRRCERRGDEWRGGRGIDRWKRGPLGGHCRSDCQQAGDKKPLRHEKPLGKKQAAGRREWIPVYGGGRNPSWANWGARVK